jgi:hypothetical protein
MIPILAIAGTIAVSLIYLPLGAFLAIVFISIALSPLDP